MDTSSQRVTAGFHGRGSGTRFDSRRRTPAARPERESAARSRARSRPCARTGSAWGATRSAGDAEVAGRVWGESVRRGEQAEPGVLLGRLGGSAPSGAGASCPGPVRPDSAMVCGRTRVSSRPALRRREARPAPGPLRGAYPRRVGRADLGAAATLGARLAGRAEAREREWRKNLAKTDQLLRSAARNRAGSALIRNQSGFSCP
jgi:hypothetical protein